MTFKYSMTCLRQKHNFSEKVRLRTNRFQGRTRISRKHQVQRHHRQHNAQGSSSKVRPYVKAHHHDLLVLLTLLS